MALAPLRQPGAHAQHFFGNRGLASRHPRSYYAASARVTHPCRKLTVYQFNHQERKDDVANRFRRERGIRDGIVFVGVAQEKAQAYQGKKSGGQFQFTRDKNVYVNRASWPCSWP